MTKETFFKEKDKLERDINKLVNDFIMSAPKDIPLKELDIDIIHHRDSRRVFVSDVIVTISL